MFDIVPVCLFFLTAFLYTLRLTGEFGKDLLRILTLIERFQKCFCKGGVGEAAKCACVAAKCAAQFIFRERQTQIRRLAGAAEGFCTAEGMVAGVLCDHQKSCVAAAAGDADGFFTDFEQTVPVALMLIAMPISGSIGHAIGIGLITFSVINLTSGKGSKQYALTYILALIFLVKFFLAV